ncbi:32 kDa beta-galactoside-binding lectin-like [Physella acuta]|uniref:32 kDa beta-galactoside-binding lectin-like n=1 Tax=Physella acuta TaxID=109671 RepID=UPI0027DCF337|nr:32 kDa beta-galactoside-binding lectin-like [Physella acuta]
MLTLHHLLLVFLANIVFFGCVYTEQTETFESSTTQNNSKRSNTEEKNYRIPYYGEVRYPMYDGKIILIEGWAPHTSERFVIELCRMQNCHYDVPLHMSVRLTTGKVHLSSKINDVWGPEYILSATSFLTRPVFEIKFVIHDTKIKVYVNEVLLEDFSLRGVNKENIKYVSARDVVVIEWILFSVGIDCRVLN